MHSYQYKMSQPPFLKQSGTTQDITKTFITSPKMQNLTESLELIQFKCYQDILKQKRDKRARDMPLSYSKSIQYLGNETGMFLRFREPSGTFDEKYSTQSIQIKIPSQQNKNGQSPLLSQREYSSPVNIRVQKIIERAKQKEENSIQSQINVNQSEIAIPFQETESQYLQDNLKSNGNEIRDSDIQMGNTIHSNSNGVSFTSSSNRLFQSLTSKSRRNKSGKLSPESLIIVQEQFALKPKGQNKFNSINSEEGNFLPKQYIPLKSIPPFIRKEYTDKSQLFQMGVLKNEVFTTQEDHPVILHQNNRLRTQWQNRVGNSSSKSSVFHDQSCFKLQSQKINRSQKLINQIEQASEFCSQQDLLIEGSSKSKIEQLIDYVQREEISNQNINHPKGSPQISSDLTQSTTENLQRKVNSAQGKLSVSMTSLAWNNQSNLLKQGILQKDIDNRHYQKLNTQLGFSQGFKQNASTQEAKIIISNQLPGNKITVKGLHQKYPSVNIQSDDKERKIYFTLPNRANMFKSKNIGISPYELKNGYQSK